MQVAISTRYCFHEATYAALRMAELAQHLGHDVRIDSVNNPPRLNCVWDKRVSSQKYLELQAWANIVVWTHAPSVKEVNFWRRGPAKLILIPMWNELRSDCRKALGKLDHVVVPHRAGLNVGDRWSKDWMAVPWDNGLPITRKDGLRVPGQVHVLVAMFDDSAAYVDLTLFDELSRLLKTFPQLHITIAYCSSRVRTLTSNRMRGLANAFKGRCSLLRGVAIRDRPLLYARHDLTMWPTPVTDIGCVGLDSLTMGTPVVAWKCPPIDEILRPDNGRLVDCEVNYSPLGIPASDCNCYRLGLALQQLLLEPAAILTLQQNTAVQLETRRKEFVRSWAKLFEDS